MIPHWARESHLRVNGRSAAITYYQTMRPLQSAGASGAWNGLDSMSSTSSLSHPSQFRASHASRLSASASSSQMLERTGSAEGGRDTLQAPTPHVLLNVR